MRREIKKYLFDIKASTDSINEYLGDNRYCREYRNNLNSQKFKKQRLHKIWIHDIALWPALSLTSFFLFLSVFVNRPRCNHLCLTSSFLELFKPNKKNKIIPGKRNKKKALDAIKKFETTRWTGVCNLILVILTCLLNLII